MNKIKYALAILAAALLGLSAPSGKALAQNPPGDQQQWWNPGDWFDDTPNTQMRQDFNETFDNDYDYYGDYDNRYWDEEGLFDEEYGDTGITDTNQWAGNDWYTDDYWESSWDDNGVGWNNDEVGDWEYGDSAWDYDDGYWNDTWDY